MGDDTVTWTNHRCSSISDFLILQLSQLYKHLCCWMLNFQHLQNSCTIIGYCHILLTSRTITVSCYFPITFVKKNYNKQYCYCHHHQRTFVLQMGYMMNICAFQQSKSRHTVWHYSYYTRSLKHKFWGLPEETFTDKLTSSNSIKLIDWAGFNVPLNTLQVISVTVFTGQMTQLTVSKHWRK